MKIYLNLTQNGSGKDFSDAHDFDLKTPLSFCIVGMCMSKKTGTIDVKEEEWDEGSR